MFKGSEVLALGFKVPETLRAKTASLELTEIPPPDLPKSLN